MPPSPGQPTKAARARANTSRFSQSLARPAAN